MVFILKLVSEEKYSLNLMLNLYSILLPNIIKYLNISEINIYFHQIFLKFNIILQKSSWISIHLFSLNLNSLLPSLIITITFDPYKYYTHILFFLLKTRYKYSYFIIFFFLEIISEIYWFLFNLLINSFSTFYSVYYNILFLLISQLFINIKNY
jgi:hypothetical protein